MDLDAIIEARVKSASLRVPPSPVVALRLGRLVADEATTLDALAAVVKQDQSLAAVVLKLANSVTYRRGDEVVSLTTAVVNLGRRALRDLAYAHALHEQALSAGPLVALRRRAWRESLTSAQVAQWVAELRGTGEDDAFVAGLLHDIGRLPVIGALEALLATMPEADTRSEDGWWSLVEQHHGALGTQLATAWALPHVIADIIAQHHDLSVDSPLLQAVRISDQVVALLDGEAGLSAEQLGTIAELSSEQCAQLATRLPRLPAYLDAFREPDDTATATADVINYELRLPDSLDTGVQVTLHVDGLVEDVDVLALDARGVVVRRALRAGRLVRLRAGDVTVHARVTACVEGDAELAPWALDAAQRTAWLAFVERTAPRVEG
jgi:putative nucleotidyltransferase with HDIG domain